jgi:predicted phosphate transport protein (TIGR00153 family)
VVRLIPRDENFYGLFVDLARRLTASAALLHKLFEEPEQLQRHAAAIKEMEHEADTITYDIILRLNRSFVTPLDREDIHLLASQLDSVVDLLDGTARRAVMFRITESKAPASKLTGLIVEATSYIEEAVGNLRKLKTATQHNKQIKELEEAGDAVYHAAVGELFVGSPNPLDVIRWKELYDTLENALDQCAHVANVLETLALKHG